MADSDWERIKQTFSAALGVPAAERTAYVTQSCADRADLTAAVNDLLRAHYDASREFLEPESLLVRAAWLFRTDDRVADRYRVIKPIARGANGEVYHVFDETLQIDIALKAIRSELLGDADTVGRIKREVRTTRDIAHDGLCRVFDFVQHRIPPQAGLPDGALVPCLTMQLLDGVSLDEWLTSRRPLPVSQALPLIQQIGDTLTVLHDAGIVHRDLKPSNVMIVATPSAEPRAVLTDFGLAKPIDAGIFETQGPSQGGAPFFMAPELFDGGRPSRATDIYAFGLLIDEMVTDRRAFSADSLHSLLLQKLGGAPERPSSRAPSLPRSWDTAILNCLRPNPAERTASASDVLQELGGKTSTARFLRWRPTVVRPRRWRRALYASVVLAILTGAAMVAAAPATTTSVRISAFRNLTGNAEYDYLATGTASELGRRLSLVPGLRVYMPADGAVEVEQAKRATFSLSGHAQRNGSTLRVTVELLRSRDGSLAWSENFDGAVDRSVELQDRLSLAAMNALTRSANGDGEPSTFAARLARSSVAQWFRRGKLPASITTNSEAFDAYMRGRYLYEERTLPSALAAVEHLTRAVALDPGFAGAYAVLADVQQVLMEGQFKPHSELLADAERYAVTAVSLDSNLPDAQLSLAAVRQAQSRWDEAEQAYRLTLTLHPSFARAKRWFAGMLLQFGRFDESLRMTEEALALDPYDFPSRSAYGLALFYARRPADAVRTLEQLLAEKELYTAHSILGQAFAYLSGTAPETREQYRDQALHQANLMRQIDAASTAPGARGDSPWADMVSALAWTYGGDVSQATPFLSRLEAGAAAGKVMPSMAGRVYAAQGRVADALTALEQAETLEDRELMYVAVSPYYDSLRAEPRFRHLLTRRRLPLDH